MPPDIGAYENHLDAPVPSYPPSITTTSLPDATEGINYSETISVVNMDGGETLEFVLLTNPEWLSIDDSGILSGLPGNDDVGIDVIISIKVIDATGFADTLTTTINVIDVENPPVVVTETLPDAVQYQEYDYSLEVTDPDLTNNFMFSILEGPEWLAINVSGVLSGIPEDGDVASDIPILIRVEDATGLADTLNTTLNVIAGIVILAEDNAPTKFRINGIYPNPFNLSTTIDYSIPQGGNVTLTIYNSYGQYVKTLKDEYQQAGNYLIKWDASNMSSGLYFCSLKANGFSETRKMVLVK